MVESEIVCIGKTALGYIIEIEMQTDSSILVGLGRAKNDYFFVCYVYKNEEERYEPKTNMSGFRGGKSLNEAKEKAREKLGDISWG